MKCANCGAELAAGQQSCPNCGTRVNLSKPGDSSQAQGQPGFGQQNQGFGQQGQGFGVNTGFGQQNQEFGQQQTQPGFGTQSQNQGGFGYIPNQNMYGRMNNQMPVNTNAPDFVMKLIIGIIYTCCCCNWIFGVLGIVFCCLMNNAYKNGDASGYRTYSKLCTVMYVVGIILYVISIVIGFAAGLFDIILSTSW